MSLIGTRDSLQLHQSGPERFTMSVNLDADSYRKMADAKRAAGRAGH